LASALSQRPRVSHMPTPLVFETMGTVVTVVTVLPLDEATRDAVQNAFHALDDRFSLYKPESEASSVGRRRTNLTAASAEYQEVYWAAIAWSEATDRAFTPHRPDGVVDLSGVVKARGIQAAGDALVEHGHSDWCLNAGGDVLVAGVQEGGDPWVVGVVDPDDRTKLWTQFATRPGRLAVATSGIQERGEHVWRMAADDTFTQVTVAAADIETADVLATAILAGGVTTLQLAQGRYDIDVLASAHDGRVWASPVFTT
jgi:thiamine biosynthesis lipoprotein